MLRMLRATMSFRRLLAPTSNDLKLLTTAGFAFVIISVIGTAGARYLGWINETGLAALMAVLTNGFLFLVLSRLSFYSFFDNFKTPPHWALRLSMALTVAVLTMALLFVASSTSRTETCEQLHEQNGGAGLDALGIEAADFKTCLVVLSIQCVATCISAAAFTWSLGTWASECTHASTLIRCAGFGWLGTMAYTVGDIAMVCPDGQMEFWSTFLLTFGSLSSATAAVWVFLMAHVRIDSLIASSGTEVWQHDAAKAVLLFDSPGSRRQLSAHATVPRLASTPPSPQGLCCSLFRAIARHWPRAAHSLPGIALQALQRMKLGKRLSATWQVVCCLFEIS
eukprot:TRINITY_DN15336_c0_g1_i2.p1 TRINITY_DN15336_c0_g1~~TRINITY_DN15336_c0_g1_i2.p1  ORF type:complete len:338 (-),score=63.82 TRINITY_DN15336_c0_g1_i2:1147-2160(-)